MVPRAGCLLGHQNNTVCHQPIAELGVLHPAYVDLDESSDLVEASTMHGERRTGDQAVEVGVVDCQRAGELGEGSPPFLSPQKVLGGSVPEPTVAMTSPKGAKRSAVKGTGMSVLRVTSVRPVTARRKGAVD